MGQLDYKGTSRWLALALCAMTGGLLQAPAMADDTEIYQATLSASGDARPKVLLLVDDSGSMGAVAQEGGEKPPYDPNATYVDAGFDDTKIYWSTSNSKPSIGTNNYFFCQQ
jgi:type IV pilus assembly protein PilY1